MAAVGELSSAGEARVAECAVSTDMVAARVRHHQRAGNNVEKSGIGACGPGERRLDSGKVTKKNLAGANAPGPFHWGRNEAWPRLSVFGRN